MSYPPNRDHNSKWIGLLLDPSVQVHPEGGYLVHPDISYILYYEPFFASAKFIEQSITMREEFYE